MTPAATPIAPRALLIEDDPADARLVRELLHDGDDRFTVTVADRVASALELLRAEEYSVVLVDLGLPDASGLEALDRVRARAGSTPLIVYSGHVDAALEGRAREHGARAVLRKGDLDGRQLVAALQTAVDGAGFTCAVKEQLRSAKADGATVTVVRLAIQVPAGAVMPIADELVVTRSVGERLAGRLDPRDGLFDLGDGRWGVVTTTFGTSGGMLAESLRAALDRPLVVGGREIALEVHAGTAHAPAGSGTADTLVERAGRALRIAPGAAPVPEQLLRATAAPAAPAAPPRSKAPAVDPGVPRRSFSRRLREAISDDQLVLHYQPVVRLGDDRIPVVEALVRWRDPERGLLPPAEFIPLAEETGLIEEIGTWALGEACRQLRAWDDAGLPRVRCAVNLSARELCSPDLPRRVAEALQTAGLPADRLEVELTESMFADPEATSAMLARLRRLGVRVAIDDFGTGYSSLAYLTRFAVDVIKVDGSFVRRAAQDPDVAEVVRAIVQIAHQLGLEVVAEGVETVEQLRFVREQGCDMVQGWLFCPAMPEDEAGEWLQWAEDRVEAVAAERGHGARKGARVRTPSSTRVRTTLERARILATLVVGCVIGYLLTWPVKMPADSACPAPGEGQGFCHFQHGWAPAATIFLACVLGVFVLVDVVRKVPQARRNRRDPVWLAARETARNRALPTTSDDPILLAATYGVGGADGTRRLRAAAPTAETATAAAGG